MLNKVILMGRLTKEPELKHTQSGKSVTSFSLAVDRTFNKSETDFFDIVAWNKTAEFVANYLHKGSLIAVEGSLQRREYTDSHGQNRFVIEVIASDVYFAESKKNNATQGNFDAPPMPSDYDVPPEHIDVENDEDDLPF